jgi:hypothetical protein
MQRYVLPPADPNKSFSVNFRKSDDTKPTTRSLTLSARLTKIYRDLPQFTGSGLRCIPTLS